MEMLDVVDEQGNVIGQDTRENIHKNGLLHREIHVWFYTSKGEIIFQHRAKDKDTYPDLLDATVGGHVEIGSGFEDTALKEMVEETGIVADNSKLKLIQQAHKKGFDTVTGKTNNVIRAIFAYKFTGNLKDLKIEEGKSEGFEAWSIERLEKITPEAEKRFIPSFLNSEHIDLYKRILDEHSSSTQ